MAIKFYSARDSEYGCFSNFSLHPVTIYGRTWRTSEHAFQGQKFHKDDGLLNRMHRQGSPSLAAEMGRDRSLPLRKDWESVKDNVMREVVYAKFSANPALKEILLSTGDEKLIEHTKNDSYWADGGDGSGKNMLGIILMEVREKLRSE